MQKTLLGRSDLLVTNLCLGTMTMGWQNDEPTSHQILDRAIDGGINFIDTADVYSRWVEGNPGGVSETYIGNWLNSRTSIGKPKNSVVIATKLRGRMWDGDDGEGLSAKHVELAIEHSLRRLQLECIDLYQCHAPDPNTPLEETWHALSKLVTAGKVRWLGLSNFSGELHRKIIEIADRDGLPRPVTSQPKYNLICRTDFEADLLPVLEQERIGLIPYSPLEGGLLTGKYSPNKDLPSGARHTLNGRANEKMTPMVVATLAEMEKIAAYHNATLSQVALAWMLAKPWMSSPIIGATSLAQLEELLPAATLVLSEEDVKRLDTVSSDGSATASFVQRGPV